MSSRADLRAFDAQKRAARNGGPALASQHDEPGGDTPPPGGEPDDLLVDMAAAMELAGEDIDYPLEPIAARGFLTLLVGRHSSFKTWLMMLAGQAVHRGDSVVAGLGCAQTGVLYVDAENGPRLMGKRFRDANIPADGLLVADGSRIVLPRDIRRLGQLVENTGVGLVVLDSLRRLAPGVRENESDDMAPIMASVANLSREHDVAVVLIHHRSSKTGAATSRGSSTIEDQADMVFTLDRVAGDPEKARRRLRAEKFRIDASPGDIWFNLGPDIDLTAGTAFFSVGAAEPYDDGGEGSGETMADYLAGQIRLLSPRDEDDGWWEPSRLASAVGRTPRDWGFRGAVALLVGSGEWESKGKSRASRYRPSWSGRMRADRSSGAMR